MNTPTRSTIAPLFAALALLLLAAVPAARAQTEVRVSTPPEADSIAAWAAQAKARFQANPGDSAGGENYRAYEFVGLIGRRVLRSLGRENVLQAYALETVLDSLGLAAEVAIDPLSPNFALLMVRNPYRIGTEAVGFLYWYKGDDLRIQGAVFKGGYRPRMRVWWTGKAEYPYEWGIIEEARDGLPRFMLLRLSPGGTLWGIVQDEERFPVLGEQGEAQWADLNRDGLPELVSWTRSPTDSLVTGCADCPPLLTERVFVEGREGFELQDERLVPTPYATLVYFVRSILDGKLAQAERLVRDPAKVREAVALGWNKRVVRNPWRVEYGESGQPWPRFLEVRFEGPLGVKRYVFHFGLREGHWIIEDWVEPKPATGHYPSVTIPPLPAAKRPAAKPPAGAPAPRPRKK